MQVIFEEFNKILPMTEKEIEEVRPFLKSKTFLKDEFLLTENNTCNLVGYIKKGSFRSFHTNESGKTINLMLNSTGDFISNYESFISREPSNNSIQSIEKSELIYISWQDMNTLFETSFYWNKLGRILTENIFIISKKRLESMIYKTPEERYAELITHSPDFFEKYALSDIASFIGVTAQSLSRIRARI